MDAKPKTQTRTSRLHQRMAGSLEISCLNAARPRFLEPPEWSKWVGSKSNPEAGRPGGVSTQVPDTASMGRPGSDARICEEDRMQIPSPYVCTDSRWLRGPMGSRAGLQPLDKASGLMGPNTRGAMGLRSSNDWGWMTTRLRGSDERNLPVREMSGQVRVLFHTFVRAPADETICVQDTVADTVVK